jgi:hypothetical protein
MKRLDTQVLTLQGIINSRRADAIMASFQMICHIPESDTF